MKHYHGNDGYCTQAVDFCAVLKVVDDFHLLVQLEVDQSQLTSDCGYHESDDGDGGSQIGFGVPGTSAGFREPAESALDDPARGQNLECFGCLVACDVFELDIAMLDDAADPIDHRAGLAAIGAK
jgi:hypothetical protein